MKKRIRLFVIVCSMIFSLYSIILLFTSCDTQGEGSAFTTQPENNAVNHSDVETNNGSKSIMPSAMLQKTIDADLPKGKNVIELMSVADYAIPMTLDAIVPQATAIVEATVNEIEYSAVGGHAWTRVGATVDSVLHGELSDDDVIDFYIFGGYMPLKDYIAWWNDWSRFEDLSDDEIDNSVIYSPQQDEDLPVEGERYMFFLGEPTTNMPEGSFQRLGQKFCTYHVEADGETLTHVPLAPELTVSEYAVNQQNGIEAVEIIKRDVLCSQIEILLRAEQGVSK